MLEIASRIERVRVGRAHAEITRVLDVVATATEEGASARLPARFLVPGLSLALDDASVRVAVDDASGARVKSARVTLVAVDRDRPLDDVEREVREAAHALDLARRLVSICETSIAALAGVPWIERPRGKRGDPPAPSPIDARIALARLQRERGEELAAELQKRRAAVVLADKRHREALARRADASTDRAARSDELKKAVVVDLDDRGEGASGGRARLLLSYVVAGARWMPAYTLRMHGASLGEASLEVRALVQQNTGEDWSRVALSLSTADLDRTTELPELQSARIGRVQPKRRTGFRAPPSGADELFADYVAALSPPPSPPPPPPPPPPPSSTTIETLVVSDDAPNTTEFEKRMDAPGGGGFGAPPKAAPIVMDAPFPARGAAPQGRAMLFQAAPAPMKKSARFELKDRIGGALRAFDDGDDGSRAPGPKKPAAEVGVDIDARSLAFGALRMPPPESPRRGELLRADVGEVYAEVAIGVSVHVSAAITTALRSASHPWLASPPSRHTVAASHAGFDFSWEAAAPVDLPSDGEAHAVALSSTKAPARVFHVVVPRESRDAYRCLEVTNPLDAPLLEGPLDVYEGRDFLLSTDLATTAPKGILRVGLGVDSAVKVARNVEFGETITGLMRGNLDLWHKVTTDITNGRRDTLKIDVRERVPTTLRDKDVKVEVARVEPMWRGYEDPTHPIQGGHVWQLEIPAGEKRTTALEYVVHIAAKHELAGGNRREE